MYATAPGTVPFRGDTMFGHTLGISHLRDFSQSRIGLRGRTYLNLLSI